MFLYVASAVTIIFNGFYGASFCLEQMSKILCTDVVLYRDYVGIIRIMTTLLAV